MAQTRNRGVGAGSLGQEKEKEKTGSGHKLKLNLLWKLDYLHKLHKIAFSHNSITAHPSRRFHHESHSSPPGFNLMARHVCASRIHFDQFRFQRRALIALLTLTSLVSAWR